MKNWLNNIALNSIRSILIDWLQNRALVLPQNVISEIATKTGVNTMIIAAVNQQIIAYVVDQVGKLKF